MSKRRKVARCELCGDVTVTTREHVVPKNLYPESVKAIWQPIIIQACADCNNGSSDDDAHFRNVLMLAGESNGAVMELWQGPVKRGLGQVDGHRRALEAFNLMKPVPDLPGNRYMIYPADDEPVLRSIRKITRGLCSYHGLPAPVPDSWVRSDVLRYEMPSDLLAQLGEYHAVPEVFTYRFASLADPLGLCGCLSSSSAPSSSRSSSRRRPQLNFPDVNRAARDREMLFSKLKRDLARFERIPEHRRQDECADEGVETCRALPTDMGVAGFDKPDVHADIELVSIDRLADREA